MRNEIIEYEDYAEIILYDRYNNERARALIDLDDIDRCRDHRWSFKNDSGYVTNVRQLGYLHRYIMNASNDVVVDHINGNKLDNRKSNLRVCTMAENRFNNKTYITNNSGYPGVSWHKKSNKWRARIQVHGRQIYLGVFESLDDAIHARRQAEIEYFGEYNRE